MTRRINDETEADCPADGSLDRFFGYNLKRAYMILHADFREAVGSDGLSAQMFSVLSLVVDTPGISQSAVARHLGIERSGLVALVDDLGRRALVVRRKQVADRRVLALHPTPEGIAARDSAAREIEAREAGRLAVLAPAERALLLSFLRTIRSEHEGERK